MKNLRLVDASGRPIDPRRAAAGSGAIDLSQHLRQRQRAQAGFLATGVWPNLIVLALAPPLPGPIDTVYGDTGWAEQQTFYVGSDAESEVQVA